MNFFAEIGTHLSGLERLRTMMEGGHLTGIEQTLGFRLVEVEDGRVVIEGTPGLHVYNPFGVVHGGYAAVDPRQCLRLCRAVQDGARADLHDT